MPQWLLRDGCLRHFQCSSFLMLFSKVRPREDATSWGHWAWLVWPSAPEATGQVDHIFLHVCSVVFREHWEILEADQLYLNQIMNGKQACLPTSVSLPLTIQPQGSGFPRMCIWFIPWQQSLSATCAAQSTFRKPVQHTEAGQPGSKNAGMTSLFLTWKFALPTQRKDWTPLL